jgi:hypothetical protein
MRKAISTVAARSTVIAVLRTWFVFGVGGNSVVVWVWSVWIDWGAIGRDCAGSQGWLRDTGIWFVLLLFPMLLCAVTFDVGGVGRETSGREKRTGAASLVAEERVGGVRRFMGASCAEKVGFFRREESGWVGR